MDTSVKKYDVVAELKDQIAKLEEKNAVQNVKLLEQEMTIAEMGWDDEFGMLTSAGTDRRMRELPRGTYYVTYIDIDDMKGLNSRYGHFDVNRRIKATFANRRESDLIGRLFVGDEILVITKNDPCDLIKDWTLTGMTTDIPFTFTTCREHKENIPSVIKTITDETSRKKEFNKSIAAQQLLTAVA